MFRYHSDPLAWWLIGFGCLPLIGGVIARLVPRPATPAKGSKKQPLATPTGFNWDRLVGLALVAWGLWRLFRH